MEGRFSGVVVYSEVQSIQIEYHIIDPRQS